MDELFKEFIMEGYLVDNKHFEYERLKHTIRIIITFWLSQQEILYHFKFQENGEMVRHIWEILLPNLTESGCMEYNRLITRFSYSWIED